MITRNATLEMTQSEAVYSDCERYRYGLRRRWDSGGELVFVMLNPSTADERRNDPTIERCQRRAKMLGFGAVGIVNLFGFRATQPRDLRAAEDPEGADNRRVLLEWAGAADMVIAAWGVHGALHDMAAQIAPVLTGDVRHLGLTRDGHPRHPLYVSYATAPREWPQKERYANVPIT